MDAFLSFFTQKRPQLVRICTSIYYLCGIVILIGFFAFFQNSPLVDVFYKTANLFGELSLILFCLLLIPGIARRFSIKNRFIATIMIYRRQIGIIMFLFALLHALTLSIFPALSARLLRFSFSPFEIWGVIALFVAFPLAITSNDTSIKFLKQNWYLLHRGVYLVMYAIFLHVALRGINKWTIVMFGFVLLETLGLVYSFLKRKKIVPFTK